MLAPGSRALTEGLKYTKWEYLKEKVHRKEQKKKVIIIEIFLKLMIDGML